LNLKEALNKLWELIGRIEGESSREPPITGVVRSYSINSDVVFFSTPELGGLMLTDADVKEYRQCVDAIHSQVSGKSEHISRSAVESFIQEAMLRALDPIRTALEKNFSKRLDSAVIALEKELKAKVIERLQTIFDPEIPVNIYSMGLIYEVDILPMNNVQIVMTLTAPSCPAAQSLPIEVDQKLREIEGVNDVHVSVTWTPQWNKSMMSEEAQLELGML